jgi:hypothetical protein
MQAIRTSMLAAAAAALLVAAPAPAALDASKVAQGLLEALKVGVENTVQQTGAVDGAAALSSRSACAARTRTAHFPGHHAGPAKPEGAPRRAPTASGPMPPRRPRARGRADAAPPRAVARPMTVRMPAAPAPQ